MRNYLLILLLILSTISAKLYAINTSKVDFKLFYYQPTNSTVNQINILKKDFLAMPSSSSLGYQNGEYWFKLIVNNINTDVNLIATVPTHNIDKIEFYLLKGKTLKLQGITGNIIPQEELPIDYKFPSIELENLNKGCTTYYLKVNFPKEANFPLNITSQTEFYESRINNQSFNSFYYGLVLMVLILNGFFYFKFRNTVFLYYTLFLFSMTTGILLYDGSFINLFRANGFGKHIEFLARLTEAISLLLFSIVFLGLKHKSPFFAKSTTIFPVIMVAFYFIFLITDQFIFEAFGDVLGISVFFILWIIGIMQTRKIPYAKFYVLGYLLILPVGAYYFIGYGFGLWEINGDIKLAKIASFIDILVFTYALTYRMKIRDEENLKIVDELRLHITESSLNLDNKNSEADPFLQLLVENDLTLEPLTRKEIEILKGLNKGLTNKQISEQLFISINTVKTHNRNIYGKFEIRSREELSPIIEKI
jgi:DNA-binding CsgD family transcriptional regulator